MESGTVMWGNTADTFNADSGLVILLVTGERFIRKEYDTPVRISAVRGLQDSVIIEYANVPHLS